MYPHPHLVPYRMNTFGQCISHIALCNCSVCFSTSLPCFYTIDSGYLVHTELLSMCKKTSMISKKVELKSLKKQNNTMFLLYKFTFCRNNSHLLKRIIGFISIFVIILNLVLYELSNLTGFSPNITHCFTAIFHKFFIVIHI